MRRPSARLGDPERIGPRSGSRPCSSKARKRLKSGWSGPWKSAEPVVSRPRRAHCVGRRARVCSLGVRDVERLDAVHAHARRSGRSRRARPRRLSRSQNGCAQTATPPAAWIAVDRLGDGRRRAAAERRARRGSGRPRAAREVFEALVAQPLRVGGMVERRLREVRPPDRRPAAPRVERRVELEAELAQRVGHPVARAPRGRRGSASSALEQRRVGVVDAVAEDVEVLVLAVDRGELGRGHDADAVAAAASSASSTPSTVSWSVSASSSTPAAAAPRARPRRGASAPSEQVECDCRSKVGGWPCPARLGRRNC